MRSRILHWSAIVLALETGILHLMTAQSEFEEAPYMGYLFVFNFLAALLASYGIYRRQLWGWLLGLFITIGSITGYILSRTQGMPGMEVEEWFSPYGIVAISVEGLFILLFFLRFRTVTSKETITLDSQPSLRYIQPIAGLIFLVIISTFTYRWDVTVTQMYGMHVGSLDQVINTPVTSLSRLEDQYGVQVSLVATSMMDSIVDVRLKIIDPEKAHALLNNQAALLVNQQSLVLAPHMHSHSESRLKAGKVFVIFFPTQRVIHKGSEINIIFGNQRIESMIVQ